MSAATSARLLGDWSDTAGVVGRMRAVESAQLAAFLLTRALNREGGEGELEAFLAAPEPGPGADPAVQSQAPKGSPAGSAVGAYDDPRISTRARGLLASEDMVVVAATLRTKLEVARRTCARAIVSFIGLHNLLSSVVVGRLSAERVERLHVRIDDALLPLGEVQALDGFLDGLDAGLSLDQFEKQARMRIRILDPVPADPDAARKKRCVRIERRDDDTAVLEMVGPIGVIEALFQRLRATARAIRRQEIGALGLAKDGQDLDAKGLAGRLSDDRRVAELMFDLLAGARPRTQVRVGPVKSSDAGRGAAEASVQAGGAGGGTAAAGAGRGADVPEGSFVDVLCPTDGEWLRKQAQVTVTVPVSTVLSLDDRPGRVNGDVPVSAEFCRDAAGYATSWYRVLTDPATSIVTDHVAQTYEPTAGMRRTVRAKWRTCTVPGCSHPAGWCEIEHCCRFSRVDPASGGLTVMENLHAMCKHHHQLKTMGTIRLQRLGRNEVAWVLPLGVTASTSPPPLAAGLDPPDPEVLLAQADRFDRAPVGEGYAGPDLFTTIPASSGSDEPDGRGRPDDLGDPGAPSEREEPDDLDDLDDLNDPDDPDRDSEVPPPF
ncbi:hypothetical protein BJEO58_02386 [Brevibacterium jeotgali]|uniref:DUF222 domain-containing protein n=1 Tax=Brevibacterium jeotgali TaxID=1262550 RepID=A0A2H1L7C2_9MICO|nr:hypothetical protein FB108_1874 [Brevibacterium jeotgali]SMY12782.1 hypothetical protein BJEO58_02386 [Brevibacterium jeotgali]